MVKIFGSRSPNWAASIDAQLFRTTVAVFDGMLKAPPRPGFWSRVASAFKNHPVVAAAAIVTIIISGGPEDPLAIPALDSVEALMGESEYLVPGPVSGARVLGVH